MSQSSIQQSETIMASRDDAQEPPFKCAYCGSPSWLEPCDQSAPADYCHDSDHGSCE